MFEHYFVRPTTVDRIRASWMSTGIEQYVRWLHERRYGRAYVVSRVQILFHFGEFAHQRGVDSIDQLGPHVASFVDGWVKAHYRRAHKGSKEAMSRRTCRPIYAFLRLLTPGFRATTTLLVPFADRAPGYFEHLRKQRGLSERTLYGYYHQLSRLETYLNKIGLTDLSQLSPLIVNTFVTDAGQRLGPRSVREMCTTSKSFLRYLYREGQLPRDLSPAIEIPRQYRLARVPRAISWSDVQCMLDVVDRRTAGGRRDYAILLLLITYGLRAREVAALTLDDLDWKRERFHVPDRKAGHSTTYPLSPAVGDAIVDYLKAGRPPTSSRVLFFETRAPYGPVTYVCVSNRATHYLRKAGIQVRRPGSHTLRHSCVQRLLDARLPLKTIGDYVGHRSAASTRVYSKVDIDALRETALGDGEAVL